MTRESHPRSSMNAGRDGEVPRSATTPKTLVLPDLQSEGEPLGAAPRYDGERRFGVDFSAVRVHHDAAAGASALAIGARAFSLGRDIFFAPGHFAPQTLAGRELLAHELHHVAKDGVQAAPRGEPRQIDDPGSPE